MLFGTKSLRSLLLGKKYLPLNVITVSKDNLLKNYSYLNSLNKSIAICPVLKSNAYGHGLIEVAKVLDSQGAPFLCVDSLFEAYELYKAHIKTKILIMGYVHPRNLHVKKLPFSYAVYNEELLENLAKYQPHAGIHIFVDTGMNREGIPLEDLSRFLLQVKKYKNIRVEGLMSHFACGDDKDNFLNKKQIENFERAKEIVFENGFNPEFIHINNSGATLNSLEKNISNTARCGISIYGIDPRGKNEKLMPVLQLETQIVQIKKLKKGDSVGYDSTYVAQKEMTIGILPIGYNDGLNRKLSNKGCVFIGGKKCAILGRISMNITAVDVSLVQTLSIGDKVIVYSRNINDENSIYAVSDICQVIPYEILVYLHASTKREIV